MTQWLLMDNSEPAQFGEDHYPLPVPSVEVSDERMFEEQFATLIQKPPHVVVLRSQEGEVITVGVGKDYGWLTYRHRDSAQSFMFVPRTPVAADPLEFLSESGLSEILPQHLLPMTEVLRQARLICFHNVTPHLSEDLVMS